MLTDAALHFLKSLLDTPGPSGFEAAPARVWRDEARQFADVRGDVAGNSLATVRGAAGRGGPTIMLADHIDEIGVIVKHVDAEGYLYIGPIGGWDPQVLVGQRLRFLSNGGDVFVSRSIDNRIGAFVVLEALRRYAEQPGAATVIAVATTQEEIGLRGGGALVGASAARPAMAIAVDVTFATDPPGVETKELGEHKVGGGPVLSRGSIISPVVFDLLRRTARERGIPHTVQAAGRDTGSDADAIHLAGEGVATALVSIPNRYMHSPNEMVSLEDLDCAATLIAETCRRATAATDFTAR